MSEGTLGMPGLPAGGGPPSGYVDSTVESGLEVKARSQWDYARRRFLRHRLAVAGLIGLIIIFGAGAFANYVAHYGITEEG